jgi:hypothetical protein
VVELLNNHIRLRDHYELHRDRPLAGTSTVIAHLLDRAQAETMAAEFTAAELADAIHYTVHAVRLIVYNAISIGYSARRDSQSHPRCVVGGLALRSGPAGWRQAA